MKKQDIDLICYDFDGVMTDNRVLVDENGAEAVWVNRADGLAVAIIRAMGIPQAIVSTETNPVVTARARKLSLPVLQGVADKRAAVSAYAKEHGFALDRTVFIGNDINDLAIMQAVGHPVAPGDAHPSVKAVAIHITDANGGEGVIREFQDTFFPHEEQ